MLFACWSSEGRQVRSKIKHTGLFENHIINVSIASLEVSNLFDSLKNGNFLNFGFFFFNPGQFLKSVYIEFLLDCELFALNAESSQQPQLRGQQSSQSPG